MGGCRTGDLFSEFNFKGSEGIACMTSSTLHAQKFALFADFISGDAEVIKLILRSALHFEKCPLHG